LAIAQDFAEAPHDAAKLAAAAVAHTGSEEAQVEQCLSSGSFCCANMAAKKRDQGFAPEDEAKVFADEKKPLLYRDGIPVVEKSPEEQEAIWWRHIDPEHADYNPTGQTTDATSGVAIKLHEIDVAARNGRKAGGRQRGKQQRQDAERAAKPIYEKYLELRKQGVAPRKLISKVAAWAQSIAAYNHLDVRQIRRAIERLKKRDSS
jgi:hypothetical protein